MADDRPLDDPVEQLGKLQRDFDDFRSTMMARLGRRPTGDVEITIRTSPKAGSLLMQGQTVSRTDYGGLWNWAQEQGLVTGALFGPGDGSTTFKLPDMQGRIALGAGTLVLNGGVNGNDVYQIGQNGGLTLRAIGLGALPTHTHNVDTTNLGNHSGHMTGGNPIDVWVPDVQSGWGYQVFRAGRSSMNNETWGGGPHSHGLDPAGDGTPLDMRQPYLVVNWLIWT